MLSDLTLAHGIVGFLRFTIIGAVCLLAGTSLQLVDSMINYTSAVTLLVAILKCIVAAIGVYLVFQLSLPLHVLFLILMSSTLILSVATGTH